MTVSTDSSTMAFRKRDLHRVEDLDDHQDQQDPVEQFDHVAGQGARHQVRDEVVGTHGQEDDRGAGQEDIQADIHEILDPREDSRDPVARRVAV